MYVYVDLCCKAAKPVLCFRCKHTHSQQHSNEVFDSVVVFFFCVRGDWCQNGKRWMWIKRILRNSFKISTFLENVCVFVPNAPKEVKFCACSKTVPHQKSARKKYFCVRALRLIEILTDTRWFVSVWETRIQFISNGHRLNGNNAPFRAFASIAQTLFRQNKFLRISKNWLTRRSQFASSVCVCACCCFFRKWGHRILCEIIVNMWTCIKITIATITAYSVVVQISNIEMEEKKKNMIWFDVLSYACILQMNGKYLPANEKKKNRHKPERNKISSLWRCFFFAVLRLSAQCSAPQSVTK